MASDSRADDDAARSLRRAIGQLVSGLSKAVFGVCAVAVGLLTLLVAVGDTTGESTSVVLLLGLASILIGAATISRLPRPSNATETADSVSESPDEQTEEASSAGHDEPDHTEADRHRQKAD